MPVDHGFVPLDSRPETSSMDYGDFSESSFEDNESVSVVEVDPAIDCWFGNMYLRCIVAENVLLDHNPDEILEGVDSLLEAKLLRYPYSKVLEFLRAQGLARSGSDTPNGHSTVQQSRSDHATLLTLIGNIVRTGERREKSTLLSGLRRLGQAGSASHNQERLHEAAVPNVAREPSGGEFRFTEQISYKHDKSSVEESPDTEDVAMYTSTLKEHGDRIDTQPSYEYITESQNPPRFKAIVSFGAYQRLGEARTKRLAKHIASRNMCKTLGISVS